MTSNYVSNLQALSIGFGTITTSATGGTFLQLPSIVCDEILFSETAISFKIAADVSGTNAIIMTVASATNPIVPLWIPTAGNSNNLFITNVASASVAVPFMWKKYNKPGRT